MELDTPNTGALILAVYAFAVGWLSERAYNGIKTVIPAWDRAPAKYHQIAAPSLGLLFGFLGARLAAEPVIGIEPLWEQGLFALLNAAVMAGIFRAAKQKVPLDATNVIEATRDREPDRPV